MSNSQNNQEMHADFLQVFVPEVVPNINYNDFDKICRTCLSIADLNNICDMVYGQFPIADLLESCTSIQVKGEDDLPQKICSSCLCELIKACNFKEKCQRSDKHLEYLKKCHSLKKNEIQNPVTDVKTEGLSFEGCDSKSGDGESCTDIEHDREESDKDYDEKSGRSLRLSKVKKKQIKRQKVKIEGPPFNCRECSETYNTREELQEHRKNAKHLEIRSHICNVCKKSFTSSKLRQHMRTHTKEKPYQCKVCLQAFSMSGNLKRHMMRHTGERPHVCEICGKGFIQATTLTNHMRTHGSNEHIQEDGSGPCFDCNFCGRSFKRLSRFNAHQQKHLSENYEIKKPPTEMEVKCPEYVCDICKRAYKTKHLLKAHCLTHGEKSFLCSECGKGFVTKAALLSHLKVHTGEKPHTCNICQKSFAHVGSFEAHILTHTGHKPYSCSVCGKAFTQLSHLKYHLRTHSGERPYMCTYCNKTFALKGNLTVHIRIHTGETPYLCPDCGKGFYDSSSMKKHRKAHGDMKLDMEDIDMNNTTHQQYLTL